MRILYITPHLSTGGAPQYLLKKIELLHDANDIYVIEYNDYGVYRVQKDKILNILNDRLITLSDNKNDILKYIDEINPHIIHFEEMPEFFIDEEIAEKIYNKNRNYLIFETSHDSSFDPSLKKVLPDKFLFCSDNQLINFRSVDVPACVIEYPVDKKSSEKQRDNALRELGVDPALKHVLNVGLWTSRKNQAEIIEYAKFLTDVQFHFVGNLAENFKDYWEPLTKEMPDNCTVWGERDDIEKFYSCMDLFLFTSKGSSFDKETNPLVVKEALSWNIPVLAHKIDSYLDKYDKKVTWLSDDFSINLVKMSRMLNISDRIVNCSIGGENPGEETRITFHFLDLYPIFHEKLLCVYEIDTGLLAYRSHILTNSMWCQPHCGSDVTNGFIVKIFDAPKTYFSNLSDEYLLDNHHLLYEKSFPWKTEVDIKVLGERKKFHGIADDPSSWYTLYETLILDYYDKLNLTKGDTVIDIGGHYGFFDMYALNKGVSHIHTIEPTKTTFDILCKNLAEYKNVEKYNLAISSDNIPRTFITIGSSSCNSFYETYNNDRDNKENHGVRKEEMVNCVTLDQFMKNNNIDRIDALKIDCEGAEWDIFPAVSDDFFRYKLRKLSMEAHPCGTDKHGVDYMKGKANKFIARLEGLGYQVIADSCITESGQLGNLWASRYPKIKIVHMLVDVDGEREKESIRHLKKLSKYADWSYVQMINPLYKDFPPKETCARPNDVQMKSGEYKLTPTHYGNFSAHRDAINEHLNEEFDAVLFCECDAVFIKPVHEVHRAIMGRLDDINQYELYYMSFGKRIPDWGHEDYEHFGVTDRMSEAHCYLISIDKKRKTYFRKKLKDTKWDTYDLWLNNNIFPDKKCGIVKNPISIQCSGDSYLDNSFKDGTTLLKDDDIETSYEEF